MSDSVFRKNSDTDGLSQRTSVTTRPPMIRRLTRRLTLSFSSRKKMSSTRSLNIHDAIKFEPTYRIGPVTKIPCQAIENSVKKLLNSRLPGMKYDPKKAALLSQILSDDIKNDVKSFAVERYKIIVQVMLGSACRRSVGFVAKSLWSPEYDNYLTFQFENEHLVVAISVYLIYQE